MHGLIINVKVIEKSVRMKNKANTSQNTTTNSVRETQFTGGSKIDRYTPIVKTREVIHQHTDYTNYTITDVKLLDEKTNKVYVLEIINQDFLPTVDKYIDIYVADKWHNVVLAYLPYKGAEPISIGKATPIFNMERVTLFFETLLSFGIPLLGFYGVYLYMFYKSMRFKDGIEVQDSVIKIIAFIVAITQIYVCYNIFEGGFKVIPEMLELSFGVATIGAIYVTYLNISEAINIKQYYKNSIAELKKLGK